MEPLFFLEGGGSMNTLINNADLVLSYLSDNSVNQTSYDLVRSCFRQLSDYLEAMVREAGQNMPPIHPHFLCRSRASNLYQNGTPIEVVSRFLGHSSVETTRDHYAYPSLEQMRTAMEAGTNPAAKEQPLWVGHEDELARLCGLR